MHTTRYMIDDGSDRPYDGEFFTREKLIDLQSPLRGVMSGHRTHSKGTEK